MSGEKPAEEGGHLMDKAWNVLSEREADILKLREERVPLNDIAEKYGVSYGRIRQISETAKRKLREEQRRILTDEANQMVVHADFHRSDLILLSQALKALQEQRSRTVSHTLSNMRDTMDNDPLYYKAGELLLVINELLNNTREDIHAYVEENSTKETQD